jgi:hypothetical protein
MASEAESKTAEGACLCGEVQISVSEPSLESPRGQCAGCRRAHGAAFVTFVGFATDQFRVTAGSHLRVCYLTATGATRSFCSICGSTLTYESPRWPGEIHVVLANLEWPIDRSPAAHMYVDHKAPWWEIEDSLPQLGGETGLVPK